MYYRNDEEKIKDLEYQIRKLERQIESLEAENKKLQREKDDAEWQIRTELEPRIKREKSAYDNWVCDAERRSYESDY